MDGQQVAIKDISSQYIDLTNTMKLAQYVKTVKGPEDLELVSDDVSLLQTGWCKGCNKIYDADGDGVEDNR